MRVSIICAMSEEISSILNVLAVDYVIEQERGFTVFRADYLGHQLILMQCGIGKVNAALHTQFLINSFSPDIVINLGLAGSLTKDLIFGDVVVATDLVQYDVDLTSFDLPLGQIPRMNVFGFDSCEQISKRLLSRIDEFEFKVIAGRIISGDMFINDKTLAESLHRKFNALACEMEGAAVAHVCYVNQTSVFVVRALSDMAGQEIGIDATESYAKQKDMVAHRSSLVVKTILEDLP